MTPLDLDALEAMAKAATPGPWRAAGGYVTVRDPACGSFGSSIYHLDELGQRSRSSPFQAVPFGRSQDAGFIAAASPSTILALCARMRLLERVAEAARPMTGEEVCNEIHHSKADRHSGLVDCPVVGRLVAALAALDAETKP